MDTTPISADTVVNAMHWRYATKAFDKTKQLSQKDKEALLTALRLSPSSYGLQPWKFFVVNNQDVRRKLGEFVPANKGKIEDSSMLVVLARRKMTKPEHVDEHIETLKIARGASAEEMQPFKDMLQTIPERSAEAQDNWNQRQVYVALGCVLTTAAILKIDACPMEGINPEGFDDILGLAGSDFTATLAVAFGYRDEKDPFASYMRARRAADEVIQEI